MSKFSGGLILSLVLFPVAAQPPLAEELSPAMALFEANAFEEHQVDIANGKQVFHAAGCAGCHGLDGDPLVLAGGQEIQTKFGSLFSPNITSDPDNGIGGWSNSDFLNAVLLGQNPDGGEYYGAVFPFASYAYMTPEDALDMRAFMQTLPSSDAKSKDHEINFSNAWVLENWTENPVPLNAVNEAQQKRGQYLAEALGHCGECHTPRANGIGFKNERDQSLAFQGESGLLGGYAPNISAARLAGFDPAAFVTGALSQAKKLNGSPMTDPRMRRISKQMSVLSIADRAAIFAYLSGTPLDVDSLPDEPADMGVVTAPPIEPVRDETGADELVARIDAYCEAPLAESSPIGSVGVASVDPGLQGKVDGLIEEHCRSCHGPGQTYQRAFYTGDIGDIARDPAVVTPGQPERSPLIESIASNRMPTRTKLSAEELQTLSNWVTALGATQSQIPAEKTQSPTDQSTPILPRFVGGSFEELTFSAAQDLMDITERDRPFVRYLSFSHVPLPEVDCNLTGALRNPLTYLHAGLNKFINSVSRGKQLHRVNPVANTNGALVRIDIRNYGWTHEDWRSLSTGVYTAGAAKAGFSRDAWADLAATYPYAIDASSNAVLSTISAMTTANIPILRAEWFVRHASESPYYDLLLQLPADIRDLETRMAVDVDQAIRSGEVLRTGFTSGASGVSDFNRLLERHDLSRGGYYWKSYDFAGDTGTQSLIQHPDGPASVSGLMSGGDGFEHDGGEMIFSLPNGMQGYYLSTHEGSRLAVGPTSIVSFRNKPIGKGVEIVNARSCFDCHENGIIAKRDEMRPYIQSNGSLSLQTRDALLDMYPEQDVVDAAFQQDARGFITALETLNATQPSAAGRAVSLQAPASAGGGEIITYLADLYFETLTAEDVAREFYMDLETLNQRVKGIADPNLRQIADTWMQRLDMNLFVTRAEMEDHWGDLLSRLTRMSAHDPEASATNVGSFNSSNPDIFIAALTQVATQDQLIFAPADNSHRPASVLQAPAGGGLQLSLSVPREEVRVHDLLAFDVTASQRCELQVLYVEEGNSVDELPQLVLGPRYLEAGETRRIPYPGSGLQLRFDSPGSSETMLAFCRVGGLGDHRIDPAEAIAKARERYQPLTKGLSIEAAGRVADSAGASALNAVTFNVQP